MVAVCNIKLNYSPYLLARNSIFRNDFVGDRIEPVVRVDVMHPETGLIARKFHR